MSGSDEGNAVVARVGRGGNAAANNDASGSNLPTRPSKRNQQQAFGSAFDPTSSSSSAAPRPPQSPQPRGVGNRKRALSTTMTSMSTARVDGRYHPSSSPYKGFFDPSDTTRMGDMPPPRAMLRNNDTSDPPSTRHHHVGPVQGRQTSSISSSSSSCSGSRPGAPAAAAGTQVRSFSGKGAGGTAIGSGRSVPPAREQTMLPSFKRQKIDPAASSSSTAVASPAAYRYPSLSSAAAATPGSGGNVPRKRSGLLRSSGSSSSASSLARSTGASTLKSSNGATGRSGSRSSATGHAGSSGRTRRGVRLLEIVDVDTLTLIQAYAGPGLFAGTRVLAYSSCDPSPPSAVCRSSRCAAVGPSQTPS
eukprot:GHVU01124769.1.p1 GENE.GHVU01124769.1~~GHVU01124769.1.p1  ORF type:complete len:362 (+),score=28.82 GHVU01124769.1:952-2037(+)